jgi:hypothetical protein
MLDSGSLDLQSKPNIYSSKKGYAKVVVDELDLTTICLNNFCTKDVQCLNKQKDIK